GVKGLLGSEGGGEGIMGSVEGSAEGIAHGLEDVAAVGVYCLAEHVVVASEARAHLLGILIPTCGAALYVGEEERDGTGRVITHFYLPARTQQPAPYSWRGPPPTLSPRRPRPIGRGWPPPGARSGVIHWEAGESLLPRAGPRLPPTAGRPA